MSPGAIDRFHADAARRRIWVGSARAALFAVSTLLCALLRLLSLPFGRTARRLTALLWFACCRAVLRIDVKVEGVPFRACPTLFVANHVSYLDIPILGTAVDATFIAKSEVRSWPGFGWIARLGGTYFVRRHWRHALIQRNDLAARMRAGESFVLFAEGTSTDGLDVLPFKSSLFSVAEPWVLDCPIAVQPVTLAYRRLGDGTPIVASNAAIYAWYADAPFLPHLWQAAQGPGLEVTVHLHEPVISWAVKSRKALARQCRATIRNELVGDHDPDLPIEPTPPASIKLVAGRRALAGARS